MRTSTRAFTLVELLVVMTILAIISVVAYTSFGGATDKAKNSTKIGHLATIESALNVFNQKNSYYPMPGLYDANTNVWGYKSDTGALAKNGLAVIQSNNEITKITSGSGGGIVYESGSTTNQIGAKGVIDSTVLSKEYLSQDLFDPSVKDIKVTENNKTMKDYGVGRYVYAVYSASGATAWNANGKRGIAYNIATTLVDESKNETTKLIGNFDEKFSGCGDKCPVSLIGPGTSGGLKDGDAANVPYSTTF